MLGCALYSHAFPPDTLIINGKTVHHLVVKEVDYIYFETKLYRVMVIDSLVQQNRWKFERSNFSLSEGAISCVPESGFTLKLLPLKEMPIEPQIIKKREDILLFEE